MSDFSSEILEPGDSGLGCDTKTTDSKRKIDKLDFMKIKKFVHQKILSTEQKGNQDWEKIFVNHVSVKGLIPRIYRELLNSPTQNKQPNSKMGRGLE